MALALGWWAGWLALVLVRGRARWLALAAPLSAALFLVLLPGPEVGRLEVTFLSVGHGDAIVLSSEGHHALIDAGGVPQGLDTGKRFVLPFLETRRIERLDLVALSHPHPDHALGLPTVLERVPAERVWLPAGAGRGPLVADIVAAAGHAPVEDVELGHAPFPLGAARVEVLGPPTDRILLEGENDRSLVLRVRHGDVTFLLPGDIEEAGEEALALGEPVTVLKAPHHGSRTSSHDALVNAAKPRYVVFCVGAYNRFGFPHAEVVDRYAAAGARCLRTDLDGAITFTSDGRDVTIETYRDRAEVDSVARGRRRSAARPEADAVP
jgi:competence protein ComEC